MSEPTTQCAEHQKYYDVIDFTQETWASIGSTGKISVLTSRIYKLRCATCRAVDLVREQARTVEVFDFNVSQAGFKIIADKLGYELVKKP